MSRASIIAISLLFTSAHAYADAQACATASLVNPYTIDGGISGTGAPAKGGVSGTGDKVAKGGVSGTGDKVAAGGVAGTGSPIAAGGVAGTGDKVAKGGVSGTGDKVAAGGVAGTGAPVAKGGGIGGTGDSLVEYALLPAEAAGDIGIMGVVTGFASICVNGEEVQYERATPIYDNGKVANLADLAVGKTVMLKVEKVDGVLHARAIGLFNAVTGPVTGINAARQEVTVMGQAVQVSPQVIRQLMQVDANHNAVLSVSGHRADGGAIVASRVDVLNAGANASTLGLVTGLAQDGFVVNGTKVRVADGKTLAKLKVGGEVQVSGTWSDGALQANHIESQPIKNVVNRIETAVLEGYVHQDADNHLSIAGTETSVEGLSLEGFKDKLVKIELRRSNSGKWIAEKVTERKGKNIDNETQFQDNSGKNGAKSGKSEVNSDNSGSGNESNGQRGSGGDNSGGSGRGDSGRTDASKADSGQHSSSSGSTAGSGRGSADRGSGRDSSTNHGGASAGASSGRDRSTSSTPSLNHRSGGAGGGSSGGSGGGGSGGNSGKNK